MRLKKYFEKRPAATELYVVGGIVFVEHDQAEKYATQINSKVDIITREDVKTIVLNPVDQVNADAESELLKIDLSANPDYSLLQKLVKDLGLSPEGKSKDSYLAALINRKAELSKPDSDELSN